MLEVLRIRNLALIADMELDFTRGMNVLTGETGAGKSFILKAITFLMGERIGAGMVRPGKERAVVEAIFTDPTNAQAELILRRELIAETGRSRLYVNDELRSQDSIKELRPALILHTSQHGQQRLLQPGFQARLVDEQMNRPDLVEEKERLVRELRETARKHEELGARFRNLSDRRELLEIHLKEIEKVAPEPGEEERLELLRAEVRAGEETRRHYQQALDILRGDEQGLLSLLGNLERALEPLARDDDEMAANLEATTAFRQNAAELERRLRRPPREISNVDPEQVESRLFALAQLKRKLHRTLPEILSLKGEIEENLSFLDACALDMRQLEKKEKHLQNALASLLELLNAERRKAAVSFTSGLAVSLKGLGFSDQIHVLAEFTPTPLFPEIPALVEDRVRLLWAPNPGQPPQPLDRIASGGELSRFLLAVVSMQAQQEGATLIFDEVDAGIGGRTLNKVAERLNALAAQRQMLLITHWPLLARHAARHFQVIKEIRGEETFTLCKRLEGKDKEAELARMAGMEPA